MRMISSSDSTCCCGVSTSVPAARALARSQGAVVCVSGADDHVVDAGGRLLGIVALRHQDDPTVAYALPVSTIADARLRSSNRSTGFVR